MKKTTYALIALLALLAVGELVFFMVLRSTGVPYEEYYSWYKSDGSIDFGDSAESVESDAGDSGAVGNDAVCYGHVDIDLGDYGDCEVLIVTDTPPGYSAVDGIGVISEGELDASSLTIDTQAGRVFKVRVVSR